MSSPGLENDKITPGFRPLDIATLAYVLLHTVLILVFMSGQREWYYSLAFYLSAAGIVLVVTQIRTFINWPVMKSIRLTYPMFLFVFFYEGLRPQLFLINHQPLDGPIHSLEMALLGSNLSFALQPYMQIWINEILSAFYLSYYFLPPAAAIVLLVNKKWRLLEEMVLSVSLTFYICYLLFVIFPVAGPRFYLYNTFYLPISGPFFTPLAQKIVGIGGLHGGAMPSSHCAAALVAIWYLARQYRWATVPLSAELLLLCLSTVYGRYHYVLDVFAGLLIGAMSITLATKWQRRFRVRSPEFVDLAESKAQEAVRVSVPD